MPNDTKFTRFSVSTIAHTFKCTLTQSTYCNSVNTKWPIRHYSSAIVRQIPLPFTDYIPLRPFICIHDSIIRTLTTMHIRPPPIWRISFAYKCETFVCFNFLTVARRFSGGLFKFGRNSETHTCLPSGIVDQFSRSFVSKWMGHETCWRRTDLGSCDQI